MRRRGFLKAVGAAPVFVVAACNKKTTDSAQSDKPSTEEEGAAAKPAGKVLLCAKCGQIKGSPECCKEGAPRCAMCGLIKGSPGCCRLAGAKADVCLCTFCGEIKGSEKCCKPGAVKCSRCGLNKGSPGCCRITREEKPASR